MSGEAKGEGEGEVVRSEDELGVKWDRCVADAIIKTGKRGREKWVHVTTCQRDQITSLDLDDMYCAPNQSPLLTYKCILYGSKCTYKCIQYGCEVHTNSIKIVWG